MLLASLLCYVGLIALCLSMTRHYGELLHGRLAAHRGRWLKVLGGSSLTLSLWAAVNDAGWGIGLVQWFAALMTSVLLLVFLIPYRPRMVLILAAAGLLLSPLAALNLWLR